jgi:hypothetical protein
MKNISRILMLAAVLSVGHSFVASSAEAPKGKSITLGDLTFSDHGTKDVKGKGALDLEADNYYFRTDFPTRYARTKAQARDRERFRYAAQLQHLGAKH